MKIEAGDLRHRMEVLELVSAGNVHQWAVKGTIWAKVTADERKNYFSNLGLGARDVTILMRDHGLDLTHALRFQGKHLFLTSLTHPERGWVEGKAAEVELSECVSNLDTGEEQITFPAVLTEKYAGFTQREPQTENTGRYVLVTPKPVTLEEGSLVAVDHLTYVVRICHVLDPDKNEYELERSWEA